jgi:signal recognition particle receptor subunit beta
MALVNHAKREINAKIVYFGPGLSGKTTNLNFIYRKLKPEHRGKLKSMNIQKDRMLFFDFAPPGQGSVEGYDVRFHIYSLTGEVTNSAAWKMVLKGADGVVFVADSAPERMAANRESLKTLEQIMNGYGRNLADLPGVLQCNKRDQPTALPLAEMQSLNPGRYPVMPAIADKGEGVLDSLFSLVKMVLKKLRESGLDLAKETEQLTALAAIAPAGREEEPVGSESALHAAAAEPPFAADSGEAEAIGAAASAVQIAPASGEEPVLALAGDPQPLPGGRLRLPLRIRYGKREKEVAVTVSISVELDET